MSEPARNPIVEDFPTLYEDDWIRVFKNTSSEVFVEDKETNSQIRISSYRAPSGGLQFTTDQLVEPIRVSNMIGWRIGPR